MSKKFEQQELDKIVRNVSKHTYVYGAVLYVFSNRNKLDLISASGNMSENSPYYIASVNKFIVSALIFRLNQQNRLQSE